MISVERARELILQKTKVLPKSATDLAGSLGCVTAVNITSPVNLPPFDQSAMDGFALRFSDYESDRRIKVVGEVAAGEHYVHKITQGTAVRIFTGASIPAGTDTVVMQEKVSLENEFLVINDPDLVRGANVRKTGSQIRKGKVALPRGMTITPGGIGYLAAMGIGTVPVISQPRITVIVTGSELKKPGKSLERGKIYESNSFALKAVLGSIGLKAQDIISIPDNYSKTCKVLRKALGNSDLILFTGGVSVGKYDFVGRALHEIGIKNIFYKIKQKPGKPLYFGRNKETVVFGLPGNPAAVLSCFYEYVYPAINIMIGNKDVFLRKIQMPISADYKKKQGLAFFLKGKISGNSVFPLEGQESYILSSFSTADCLIYLPAERENVKAGEMTEVHLLPGLY